ncbi:MAG: hypothetical protein HY960_06080 [Ignavibacteriae bacterium]|nr:hypothetical protein [Ignavibacteriota bacterium]
MKRILLLGIFIFSLLSILGMDCEGDGNVYQNSPPIARLSNIPPTNIVSNISNPVITLSWVGDDPDGYITAYKYRWSFTNTHGNVTDTLLKSWYTILNIRYGTGTAALALMIDTTYSNSELLAPKVYKYFANLNPKDGVDLTPAFKEALYRGDTVLIEGVRVYASNPDSTIEQATGTRIVKRFPVHENSNSGTFIFDSQDSLNYHEFEIRAIDNLGTVGAPATVEFVTPRISAPNTYIVSSPQDTSFILDRATATFTGLEFSFNAYDVNSRTREYQWVVDKDKWVENNQPIPWSPWSERTEALVNASHFHPSIKYDIRHTFHVRARNEFGSIDTLGLFWYPVYNTTLDSIVRWDTTRANVDFYTIYPDFMKPGYQKKTLLLNFSYEYKEPEISPAYPTYATLNSFYESIMADAGMTGKYKLHLSKKEGFPQQSELGKYSSIVLFADVTSSFGKWDDLVPNASVDTNLSFLGKKAQAVINYCRIGGRMIWSTKNVGLGLNVNIQEQQIFPRLFHADLLRDTIFHNPPPGFIGPRGLLGYPDASLDSSKLDPAWNGRLPEVWLVRPIGFGERIYQFDHATDSFLAENFDIGVRYEGVTFSNILLGFPLYYMKQADAALVLKAALDDIEAR